MQPSRPARCPAGRRPSQRRRDGRAVRRLRPMPGSLTGTMNQQESLGHRELLPQASSASSLRFSTSSAGPVTGTRWTVEPGATAASARWARLREIGQRQATRRNRRPTAAARARHRVRRSRRSPQRWLPPLRLATVCETPMRPPAFAERCLDPPKIRRNSGNGRGILVGRVGLEPTTKGL
jgi:hypothetical protein